MIYDWYRIFNLDEFEALGLVSNEYTVDLAGIGQVVFLVTKGNEIGVTYDDVFLALNFNLNNPYEFDDRALFLNTLNNDVYYGFVVPDET